MLEAAPVKTAGLLAVAEAPVMLEAVAMDLEADAAPAGMDAAGMEAAGMEATDMGATGFCRGVSDRVFLQLVTVMVVADLMV
jgi:hypothetical protein